MGWLFFYWLRPFWVFWEQERVLLHWAETRMSTSVEAEDEEVLEGLVKKVGGEAATWHPSGWTGVVRGVGEERRGTEMEAP